MPLYNYRAKTLDGKIISGELEANSEADLKLILKKQGMLLTNHKLKENKKINMFFQVRSTPSRAEVVLFFRQISIMVSSGISLEDAVKIVNQQSSSSALRNILTQIEEELYKGALFSDALAKFPKVFPSYFRNMIYIGEVSGQIATVLKKAADFYEKDEKMKRKASTAMVYPTFLFIAIIAVFIFLLMFIVPRFEETLTQMDTELPRITQIIISISDFISTNFIFIIIFVLVFVFLVWLWFKTKLGLYFKDLMKLKLPILRKINYYLITTRFSKGLSVLVSSGMNVMESIELIGKLMNNVVFEKKFQYVVDEIKRGKKIHKSIEHISFFPKMLAEMINVGESTGNLDEVLDITSNYYDERLEQSITKGTQLLEPFMIVFAGLLVGIVVLSVFLPMISMMNNI
jgi:type IV pilus assembly protein PilC